MQKVILFLLLLFWITPAGAATSDDIEIKLQRMHQGWGGPRYTITIHGDGRVVFDTGTAHGGDKALLGSDVLMFAVMFPGRHESRIPPANVVQLLAAFDRVNFFELGDVYQRPPPGMVADQDINRLTIRVGPRYKSVLDDDGERHGMPPAVRDLMRMIDQAASTHRWTHGNPGMVADHVRRNGPMNNDDGAARLLLADARGQREMILALVNAGAPLFHTDPLVNYGLIGPFLHVSAIHQGWDDVAAALTRRMAVPN